jgi:hypothetical protein
MGRATIHPVCCPLQIKCAQEASSLCHAFLSGIDGIPDRAKSVCVDDTSTYQAIAIAQKAEEITCWH